MAIFHCFQREREEEREEGEDRNIDGCLPYAPGLMIGTWLAVPHACALTGDQACSLGMCPGWKSNPPPFGYRRTIQPTVPHMPGPVYCLKYRKSQNHIVCSDLHTVTIRVVLYAAVWMQSQSTKEFKCSALSKVKLN